MESFLDLSMQVQKFITDNPDLLLVTGIVAFVEILKGCLRKKKVPGSVWLLVTFVLGFSLAFLSVSLNLANAKLLIRSGLSYSAGAIALYQVWYRVWDVVKEKIKPSKAG